MVLASTDTSHTYSIKFEFACNLTSVTEDEISSIEEKQPYKKETSFNNVVGNGSSLRKEKENTDLIGGKHAQMNVEISEAVESPVPMEWAFKVDFSTSRSTLIISFFYP